MTAQILAIAFGFATAALMARHDYRQNRSAEAFAGAIFTLGLVITVVLALGAQA